MTFELKAVADGETLSMSLYPGAFALKVGDGEVYSLDGEGRLVGAFSGDRWLRRGLDNTVVEKRAESFTTGWTPLPPPAIDGLLDSITGRLGDLYHAVHERRYVPAEQDADPQTVDLVWPWLQRAAEWDSLRYRRDAERFRQIYRRVTILPPDQYLSVVLQPTEGCQYNRCTFCDFYRDRPFRIKTVDEFRRHIGDVREFFGRGLARRRSIFLGDANALTIPTEDLDRIFHIVRDHFPVAPGDLSPPAARRWLSARPLGFDGIYSFLDVFSGRKKCSDEYAALRALGLRRVYIGLESGHMPLLQFLRKPERVEDAVELVHALHQAGVSVGVIVMVGIGGAHYAEGHIQDTVEAVNAMALRRDDFLYLSEFVEHAGGEYARLARAASIEPLDAESMDTQARSIRQELAFPAEPPRISVYRISEFVY